MSITEYTRKAYPDPFLHERRRFSIGVQLISAAGLKSWMTDW
jgi:hypothetical protein